MRSRFIAALALSSLGCGDLHEETIAYDPRFGHWTKMDMYAPTTGTLRPAVMIVHGGGWRLFHKERYTVTGRRLARAGYVAFSVEYRLVPEGRFPNAVHDVACALAYIQNHADELGVDPNRIATLGYSAGAHLTALVAVANTHPTMAPDCAEGTPAKPAAVISAAGPADLIGLADVGIVEAFVGGTVAAVQATYIVASPITHVTPDDPPFLLIHGTHDVFVPFEQSVQMREELRADGVEAELLAIRGSGHIINSTDDLGEVGAEAIPDTPEAWIAIDDFLARHIGRP